MRELTIESLAHAGGVDVETVREYQRHGLLETPQRLDSMGLGIVVRRYGEQDVRRLRFICSAKAIGFTLEQISELIPLDSAGDCTRARELARERIAALDAKIAELKAVRDALSKLAQACANGSED
jgi:MerR family mercuric resistance operon transcriptional regulator